LKAAGQTLALAESCTGGLVAQMLTAVSGASAYFLGGVVAYANRVKTALLGVPAEVIAAHGAVSQPVAAAMADGCRQRFLSHWAVAVTGVAGPAGGSAERPVGLAYIAVAGPAGPPAVHQHFFPGPRDVVRTRAALAALNHLRLALGSARPSRP
jgi:nicotinamide-nucleotide amidase